MTREAIIRLILQTIAALLLPTSIQSGQRAPNVVFLLVDDWGWTDAGFCGSDLYQTPHMDRLALESVRFTQAYSASTVCSPTRAAILTGQSPARLRLTDFIPGHARPFAKLRPPDWTQRLEFRHTTIAESLKNAGYKTAHVGKWHLAPRDRLEVRDYFPQHHGFDVNIGGDEYGQPGSYFHPYRSASNKQRAVPLEGGRDGEYLTDRLTDEVLELISLWQDRPFFIYLSYYSVHTPLEAKKELIAKYRTKAALNQRHKNPIYAAMVESVDQSVGRIRRHIQSLGLDKDTILFLTGDNGGLTINKKEDGPTNNFPLKEGKGHAYEGGTRVPLLIRWPAHPESFGKACSIPVISMDFLPTISSMTRFPPPDEAGLQTRLDGRDLTRLLQNPKNSNWPRESLFWHYPHYHPGGATPYSSIRKGDWKWIFHYEDNREELFNLRLDIRERYNRIDLEPEKAAELRKDLQNWLIEVDAQMPGPNPNHDPTKNR